MVAGAAGGNSFTGETLVHVRDRQGKPALKPIADIQIGDEVLAWDEMAAHDGKLQQGQKGNSQEIQAKTGASAQQTSATRYEKVSDVFSSEKERKLVHFTLEGGKSITATDGHPFRTSEGWRDAVLLKKGTKLLLMGSGEGDDDSAGISTIEDVRIETKTVRVYNLEVENLHTFFVGDQGYVVHNVHGNSASSTRPQHGYEIFDTVTGDIMKPGISGGCIGKNGKSQRAQRQVDRFNANNPGRYDSRVVVQSTPGSTRQDMLNWERQHADYLRANGAKLPFHVRP